MARTSPTRGRPTAHTAPRPEPRSEPARPETLDTTVPASGGFAALLETAMREILAVTYWFEPAPRPDPYPVTIRFTGRRVGAEGPPQPGDRFVQDETIAAVVPGSGPISVTTRVRDLTPGAWTVTAQVQGAGRPARGRHERRNASPAPEDHPIRAPDPFLARWWRRWAPATGPSLETATPVQTCPPPFARVPGILTGIWGVLVTLGLALAIALQALVIAHDRLAFGPVWAVWLVAIPAGIVGAKLWYAALHPDKRGLDRLIGWCIQGFILGAVGAAALVLAALRVPASRPGAFLDATAPGLLAGMAVGRVGCFLAGCCGGPPTAARWGVWSSDQRVGARRVPTQLLEAALAAALSLGTLLAVLGRGPAGGALFVAALAAYTLGRQGILSLRAAPRKTRLGGPVTATAAALALVVAVVFLAR